MNPHELSSLIRQRRTIKPITADGDPNYLPDAIDAGILDQLLTDANWAPTHGLTEPWRFIVIQGPARAQLADFLATSYEQHTAADQFRQSKLAKIRGYAESTTVAIALGMQRHGDFIPAEEEVIAVACAVQNMQLTAAAHGLGSFWSSSPIYDLPSTREHFGWSGDEDRCLGILYLGYPANEWPQRKRGGPGDVQEKVQWRS